MLSSDGVSQWLGAIYVRIKFLTQWSKVLHEKLIAKLVKKIPPFYGATRFITAFTRSYHWILSRVR